MLMEMCVCVWRPQDQEEAIVVLIDGAQWDEALRLVRLMAQSHSSPSHTELNVLRM